MKLPGVVVMRAQVGGLPVARNGGIDHRPVEHAARAVGAGEEAAKHREPLLAHRVQPAQFAERIRMIVGADIEIGIRHRACRSSAPPTACRACRRPPPRPLPAR